MLIGTGLGLIGLQLATLKLEGADLTVTPAAYLKVQAQRIHGLKAHTVQAHALLESLAVKLTAGIEDTDSLQQLTLRDSTAIVTHHYTACINQVNLDALARVHAELIHTVVYYLL